MQKPPIDFIGYRFDGVMEDAKPDKPKPLFTKYMANMCISTGPYRKLWSDK